MKLLISVLVLLLCALSPALGQDLSLEISPKNVSFQSSSDYWTVERLKSAVPFPLPRESRPTSESPVDYSLAVYEREQGVSSPGRVPAVKVIPNNAKIFEPAASSSNGQAFSEEIPLSTGGNGYFSSSRVIPAPAVQNSYPYRTVGKLFFADGGLNYICSASVLRSGLVVTAGHCVYNAAAKRWHTNFRFIPAYHNGAAPYGQWTASYVITTSAWVNGGGLVPNAGDFAVMEMNRNANNQLIGQVTGYLGYATYALSSNHVKMLGYPGSFDSGTWMHEVNSGSVANVAPNCVKYGSDMTGGSSGGPWVQNFGSLAAGQTISGGVNQVVGITSYGPKPEYASLRYQGSSILDSTFANASATGILNKACAHRVGNCP